MSPVIKSSFAAVADERTRLLILGSLPGEASLAQAQYYAHPRNQFWRLIGAVVGADLTSLDYRRRLDRLGRAGIGLWDVIGAAERAGSLDAAIRRPSVNPLAPFAASLPRLRMIAFNGGAAARAGIPLLGAADGYVVVALPSSSPAHTAPFETKLRQWLRLRDGLEEPDASS